MLVRYEEFGNRNAKFQFFSKITDISRSWTDFEFTVIPGVEVQNITLKTSIMVLVRTNRRLCNRTSKFQTWTESV